MSRGTVHPQSTDWKKRKARCAGCSCSLGTERRSRGTCRGGLIGIHSGAIWPLSLARVAQLTRKPPMRSQPESGVRTLSCCFALLPLPPSTPPFTLSHCISLSLFLATILCFFSVNSACKSNNSLRCLNTHPSPPWSLDLDPFHFPCLSPPPSPHSSSTLRLTQTQHTQRNFLAPLRTLATLRILLAYVTSALLLPSIPLAAHSPIVPSSPPATNPFNTPIPPIPSLPSRHRTSLASEIRFSISTDDKARNLANQHSRIATTIASLGLVLTLMTDA